MEKINDFPVSNGQIASNYHCIASGLRGGQGHIATEQRGFGRELNAGCATLTTEPHKSQQHNCFIQGAEKPFKSVL